MIVGTAGHIDHGKTTLVRALTGVETDRLEEEKKRGISIELGYAYLSAGEDETLGFIDVPGHERLVHTMAAGASGIDFGLLVIAADDGIMPQTREHLAILDLLGIRHGAVALTKTDRTDPARQASVRADIGRLVAGTFLRDPLIFPVNALDAASPGVQALLEHLRRLARGTRQHPVGHLFRLAVDRVFSLPGHGTVVTGTVHRGCVRIGDDTAALRLMPQDRAIRVRSIHAQNQASDGGQAGQRCALNLVGIDTDVIQRGNWIADARCFLPSRHVDVEISLLPGAEPPIRTWTPIHAHLGADHRTAHIVPLTADQITSGQTVWVQLVFDEPVCTMTGDRLIIRDAQARHTLGGGVVLDANAPERRRKSPARLAWLQALSQFHRDGQVSPLLQEAAQGLDEAHLLRLLGREIQDADLPADARWVQARTAGTGRTLILQRHWDTLGQAVISTLRDHHARSPDEPGADPGRLRRMVLPTLPLYLWSALLDDLIGTGQLKRNGPWLYLPGHAILLAPEEVHLAGRLSTAIERGAFDPPWVRDLARQENHPEEHIRQLLLKMTRTGQVHQIVRDLFYDRGKIALLAEILDTQGGARGITAAQFRDACGLGRKRAIQILEFFDRAGYTRRLRDRHIPRGDSAAFWRKLS